MQNKTTKNQTLIVLVYVITLLIHLPILAIEFLANKGAESSNKTVSKISIKIGMVTYKLLQPLLRFTESITDENTSSEIEVPTLEDKMTDDFEFNCLLDTENETMLSRYEIDDVKVCFNIYKDDYNTDLDIYNAYQDSLSIIDELKYTIPDYLKKWMVERNVDIKILSDTLYKQVDSEKYVGLFSRHYDDYGTFTHAEIVIRLTNNLMEDKKTLYHEVGHFLDFVSGSNPKTLSASEYESSDNFLIEHAFYKEAHLIRDYATKNKKEYIACAFEYKLAGGDMSGLPLTDHLLTYLSNKAEALSEKIDILPWNSGFERINLDILTHTDDDVEFEDDDEFEAEFEDEDFETEEEVYEDEEYEYETEDGYEYEKYEYEDEDDYEEISAFDLDAEFPSIDFDSYLASLQ